MSKQLDKYLKIPVRYVDERWECEYGGVVPAMPGAKAEIVIGSRSIADKKFLERMRAKSSIKVLDHGTKLLVYLATKDQSKLNSELRKHLIPWQSKVADIATSYIHNGSSGGLSLIEVSIGDPNSQQARKFNTTAGGLWLLTEGPKAVGLQSSSIRLPAAVSDNPVFSLNHAFTKLSEAYEPWRISHTGNVYQHFLYQEGDGKWYPLDLLRNATLAKVEQEIAYTRWQDFMRRMAGYPE